MELRHILTAAAVASLTAGAAAAQNTAFTNEDAAADAFENLEEDIQEDFDEAVDNTAFGTEGRSRGWSGQIAARATGTSGNTDNIDIGVGTKFGYFDGVNGHDFTLSYTYGEDDGTKTQDSLLAGYNYTRNFGTNLFGFAKATTAMDEFSSYESDTFVGVGVGYRIINRGDVRWSVQAGPGYRFAEDADGTEIEETAISLSSNYYNRMSPTTFITNDTDVLSSESDTAVTNELGLNVSMTNTLALRTSLVTEYHSDPLPGFEETDNTVGVSIVYTFD